VKFAAVLRSNPAGSPLSRTRAGPAVTGDTKLAGKVLPENRFSRRRKFVVAAHDPAVTGHTVSNKKPRQESRSTGASFAAASHKKEQNRQRALPEVHRVMEAHRVVNRQREQFRGRAPDPQ
jgi:hypothetical protein